jgi:hypothetical protein
MPPGRRRDADLNRAPASPVHETILDSANIVRSNNRNCGTSVVGFRNRARVTCGPLMMVGQGVLSMTKTVYAAAAKRAGKRARAKLFMAPAHKVKGREAKVLRYLYREFLVAELAAAGVLA